MSLLRWVPELVLCTDFSLFQTPPLMWNSTNIPCTKAFPPWSLYKGISVLSLIINTMWGLFSPLSLWFYTFQDIKPMENGNLGGMCGAEAWSETTWWCCRAGRCHKWTFSCFSLFISPRLVQGLYTTEEIQEGECCQRVIPIFLLE